MDGNLTASETLQVEVTATNQDPTAQPDAFTVDEDSSNNLLAVLADNGSGPDSDPDGGTLSLTGVTSPGSAGGAITINGDNLSYTPAADFNGQETFSYTLSDGQGGSDTGQVTVTVTAQNDPPTLAAIGNQSVEEGETLSFVVSASDVDSPAGSGPDPGGGSDQPAGQPELHPGYRSVQLHPRGRYGRYL